MNDSADSITRTPALANRGDVRRWLRYGVRVPMLVWHLAIHLPLCLIFISPLGERIRWGDEHLRHRFIRWWSAGLMRIFGFRVRRHGTPLPGSALVVANHMSWLDIELIHSQRAVEFVAKSEISRWPVVGWLARQAGTIYHRRGSTESLSSVAQMMVERLRAGAQVGVFPEGGTTDGSRVRVFHARIFQTAVEASVPVQPVALRYLLDGQPNPSVPFLDGESFFVNFVRLLGEPGMVAEVHFLEPVEAGSDGRRRLAERARERIALVLGHEPGPGARAHMTLPRSSHPHINFRRRGPLANAHVQSMLASSGLRRAAARLRFPSLHEASSAVILDCGDGVRLQGFHSVQSALPRARGLVVLLHGWEGSVQSSYLLVSAGRLLAAGFDVFRLHFRDHGDTHALNEGLFHSCRLDEVVGAVRAIERRYTPRALLIAGFSLGGNFALRVARKAPEAGIDLRYAFAVCPPIDPAGSLRQIEIAPWIYERYFIAKWTDSLRRKQALFPQVYDFSEWLKKPTLRDLTARMVEAYTDYPHLDDYLRGYSIAGDRLAGLTVPATIVTAHDDPVIPIDDYHDLTLPAHTELVLAEHGGHCGFIEDWRLKSWIEDVLVDRLTRAAG